MSLFRYKVLLADGKEMTSRVTAKTELAAKTSVEKRNQVKQWHWIREEKHSAPRANAPRNPAPAKPAHKSPPSTKPAAMPPPTKPTAKKPMTKLEKLLYLQSDKCFFCGQALTKDEASIEHLQPRSGGGNNADGNLVVCCKRLNQLFGSISLRRKFEIILEKAGDFQCPR